LQIAEAIGLKVSGIDSSRISAAKIAATAPPLDKIPKAKP